MQSAHKCSPTFSFLKKGRKTNVANAKRNSETASLESPATCCLINPKEKENRIVALIK
jgi:hypothetical protein